MLARHIHPGIQRLLGRVVYFVTSGTRAYTSGATDHDEAVYDAAVAATTVSSYDAATRICARIRPAAATAADPLAVVMLRLRQVEGLQRLGDLEAAEILAVENLTRAEQTEDSTRIAHALSLIHISEPTRPY